MIKYKRNKHDSRTHEKTCLNCIYIDFTHENVFISQQIKYKHKLMVIFIRKYGKVSLISE